MMALYAQLNVAMCRDPKLLAAGPTARLLYIQAVLYCRENLTDGFIDDLHVPLVALDVRAPRRHFDRLVDVNALIRVSNSERSGYLIPERVWREWNPTRAEIDERRQADTERKARWRAQRKAEQAAGHDDVPPGHEQDATDCPDGTPASVTPPATDTHSHSHSQSHSQSSSVESLHQGYPQVVDDDDVDDERATRIIELAAERRIAARRTPPDNPHAYRSTVITSVALEVGDQIRRRLERFPTAPDTVHAAAALGDTQALRYYDDTEATA